MPYSRNSELPTGVRGALPSAAQTVFRNAFNSAADRGLSEERAFRIAWGAVRNAGWQRTDEGKWVKKKVPPPPAAPAETDATLSLTIAKVDADQRLVFGWLSVIEHDGQPVVDLEGDMIEPAELEKAAYDFVTTSRVVGEMHDRLVAGEGLVESMVFSREKQEALGIDLGKVGWWVGFRVDAEAFAKVKAGELRAFSIGGKAMREDLPEAA